MYAIIIVSIAMRRARVLPFSQQVLSRKSFGTLAQTSLSFSTSLQDYFISDVYFLTTLYFSFLLLPSTAAVPWSWPLEHLVSIQKKTQAFRLQYPHIIPHICHGHTDGVRGEKINCVEKFQISVHETCGES